MTLQIIVQKQIIILYFIRGSSNQSFDDSFVQHPEVDKNKILNYFLNLLQWEFHLILFKDNTCTIFFYVTLFHFPYQLFCHRCQLRIRNTCIIAIFK